MLLWEALWRGLRRLALLPSAEPAQSKRTVRAKQQQLTSQLQDRSLDTLKGYPIALEIVIKCFFRFLVL